MKFQNHQYDYVSVNTIPFRTLRMLRIYVSNLFKIVSLKLNNLINIVLIKTTPQSSPFQLI